jgi:dethiobiotin synthetase
VIRGLAILGTDTGVGKTVVTAAMVVALRRRGLETAPWKPVASGGVRRNGRWLSPDALWWKRVLSLPDDPARLNPVCWRRPLAPAVAARLARARPAIRLAPPPRGGRVPVLLEGVGGVLVPVAGDRLFADLPAVRALPAVVVGRAGLGSINHTLLTLEALRRRGIRIAGVVLNGARAGDAAARTNPAVIARLGRIRVLTVLPRLPGGARTAGAVRALATRLPGAVLAGWLRA